jgi:hypothetical protein
MKIIIKKYYLLTLFAGCLLGNTAFPQYSANLLLGRPPSYLSDWNNPIAGQLIVSYTGAGNSKPVKIFTRLQDLSGNLIASSNLASAQTVNISNGNTLVRMDRVLQLENLRFNSAATTVASSGKLPAGTYEICIQLTDANGNALTDIQCRSFTQVNYQLPFLLAPNDKTWLDANTAQTAITFRWSNLTPASQEQFTYRLQVYEILDAQAPMQALRGNQPILLTDIVRQTQYIWRPQLSFKDSSTHTFIWTLQTLDRQGIPVASTDENNQGRSEPRVFGICNKKAGGNIADCGIGYEWK